VRGESFRILRLPIVLASALFVLGTATPARAQGQPARILILGPAEEPRFTEIAGGFRQGLRDHAHADGTLEIIEGKVARGDLAAARTVVAEATRKQVALLFVIGSELTRAARQVSADIPIVFITPGDPVVAGLVASLARPGGNTTAMTFEYPELSAKRLELLHELSPRLRNVLVLHDSRDASPRQGLAAIRDAAPKLAIKLIERELRGREELARALETLRGADAVLLIPGGRTSAHYRDIIQAANARRLPSIVHSRTSGTADALVSYGASDALVARQAARLVDKILKGENAGTLPVERPSKLELVINLKTAKALGLALPPTLLARADRVIE
jgi:putative ABC transport system substrate-binding protein